ncbi:hypothetical protein AGMMS50229_12650 [Campylobacterota bacterium]|nr:hypothetical protein AGMMS50229_12650 [Campylobacterota bacterium]
MVMTHYMELLAANQPWNLLMFMALPVILAETIAITELYLLYRRKFSGRVRTINRIAGIASGVVFAAIILYLLPNAVVPITAGGEWRTFIDVFAVLVYLLSGVPLILVALQDLGLIQRKLSDEKKLGWHVSYIAAFLVLGHLAMIAGMTDPTIFGYDGAATHGEVHSEIQTPLPSQVVSPHSGH